MDKKKEEKIVLNNFIRIYKGIYGSNENFEILEKEVAQKYYPNYNGENPDFLVRLNDNIIGMEIFELVRNKLEELNRSNSEIKLKIKNAAHLQSIREKERNHNLYLMEDLAVAALDRINDKIQNKIKNYIDCPIWLIGYANKFYNFYLLSPYFEDKKEKDVALYISQNILEEDRINKIFLVEFSSRELILEIK